MSIYHPAQDAWRSVCHSAGPLLDSSASKNKERLLNGEGHDDEANVKRSETIRPRGGEQRSQGRKRTVIRARGRIEVVGERKEAKAFLEPLRFGGSLLDQQPPTLLF